MSLGTYEGRKALAIENKCLRVTVLAGGGHVAEILHKPSALNPLWKPPWPSIEPSSYSRDRHPEYGTSDEALILSGIMGHSICLDTYGSPSPEEFAAGIPVHGEGSVVEYALQHSGDYLSAEAILPLSHLRFRREIRLNVSGRLIQFRETLENLSCSDRPISWMQHITLGPPFLQPGTTQFRAAVTRGRSAGSDFGGHYYSQQPFADFEGFSCPRKGGGFIDFRFFPAELKSGGFTTHLVDPHREDAFFAAWSPNSNLLFGYVWKRRDFPWMCRWEENHLRDGPPWNGKTLACGMEFGLSPLLGSRRELVRLGTLFDTPTYRWLPARTQMQVDYSAFIGTATTIPDNVSWNGKGELLFA